MTSQTNPFAPPAVLEAPTATPPATPHPPPGKRRSVAVSLALWGFICIVSAAPSFAWGLATIAQQQAWAMCLGVAMFIAAYCLGDQLTQTHAWRQQPMLRLTLKIGYTTRLLVSAILPIGASLDLTCGLLSVGLVQAIAPGLTTPMVQPPGGGGIGVSPIGFWGTLAITLTQGLALNLLLLGYMLLVLGSLLAFTRYRQNR